MATKRTAKIELENVKILPKSSPGLTVAEVQERVLAHLPGELFPGGAKAGWWTKAVQLDLEAKGSLPLGKRAAGCRPPRLPCEAKAT
jgi:hypothetical protein